MPHASHRLDLLLVSMDPERAPDLDGWAALRARWEAEGRLRGGRPGPAAARLVAGGFARAWLDDPGRMVLYANQQGGYRVACPRCGAAITAAFSAALQRWREGGPRALPCPACAEPLPLERAALSPPGAFGRFAIVFADAGAIEPDADALRALEAIFGPLHVVLRRVG